MDFRIIPVVESVLKGHRFDSFQELSYELHRVVSSLDSMSFTDLFYQWI